MKVTLRTVSRADRPFTYVALVTYSNGKMVEEIVRSPMDNPQNNTIAYNMTTHNTITQEGLTIVMECNFVEGSLIKVNGDWIINGYRFLSEDEYFIISNNMFLPLIEKNMTPKEWAVNQFRKQEKTKTLTCAKVDVGNHVRLS